MQKAAFGCIGEKVFRSKLASAFYSFYFIRYSFFSVRCARSSPSAWKLHRHVFSQCNGQVQCPANDKADEEKCRILDINNGTNNFSQKKVPVKLEINQIRIRYCTYNVHNYSKRKCIHSKSHTYGTSVECPKYSSVFSDTFIGSNESIVM